MFYRWYYFLLASIALFKFLSSSSSFDFSFFRLENTYYDFFLWTAAILWGDYLASLKSDYLLIFLFFVSTLSPRTSKYFKPKSSLLEVPVFARTIFTLLVTFLIFYGHSISRIWGMLGLSYLNFSRVDLPSRSKN